MTERSPVPDAGASVRWQSGGVNHLTGAAGQTWWRDHVLWLVLTASTATRVGLALAFPGFVGGDDVEVLEEGFRRAFGLAFQPWSIRNLLVPDLLVAPLLRLASWLGVQETGALIFVATLPFIALASLNVVLVYTLAARWSPDRAVARLAAALFALHWLPLGYGSTVYPRTLATTCVLLACLAGVRKPVRSAAALAAGGLLAVAFAERYSEGVLLAPLLLWCMSGSARAARARAAGALIGGFVVGAAVTVGVVDAVTWGRPFASLQAFAQLTLVERLSSSRIPIQPLLFYVQRLLFWVPATLLPALVAAARRKGAGRLWALLLLPIGLLSLVHHKELRYLQCTIPALALLGALGFRELAARWGRVAAAALVVLTLVWQASGVSFLARNSLAAVAAAKAMRADAAITVVALSQAWAYGDRLYLGNRVEVRDLPTPPGAQELERAAAGADRVALYRNDLTGDPALATVLTRHGFTRNATFERGASKAVVVFAR